VNADAPAPSSAMPAPMGHNKPPIPELLKEAYADLVKNVETWLAGAGRAPATVEDDMALANFATIVSKLTKYAGEVEKARKDEKQPYLDGGREIDAFFSVFTDKIATAKTVLERRQKAYAQKKLADERARQAEIARAAEREATDKLRQAEHLQDKGDFETSGQVLNEAVQAQAAANTAAKIAVAPPAEIVRARATSGALASARTVWIGTVENFDEIDLNQLKAQFSKEAIQKAVDAFVRLGGRQLKGVKIEEDLKMVNR
jgi:hypothetical protein